LGRGPTNGPSGFFKRKRVTISFLSI
jgi:hypothetical protein